MEGIIKSLTVLADKSIDFCYQVFKPRPKWSLLGRTGIKWRSQAEQVYESDTAASETDDIYEDENGNLVEDVEAKLPVDPVSDPKPKPSPFLKLYEKQTFSSGMKRKEGVTEEQRKKLRHRKSKSPLRPMVTKLPSNQRISISIHLKRKEEFRNGGHSDLPIKI